MLTSPKAAAKGSSELEGMTFSWLRLIILPGTEELALNDLTPGKASASLRKVASFSGMSGWLVIDMGV